MSKRYLRGMRKVKNLTQNKIKLRALVNTKTIFKFHERQEITSFAKRQSVSQEGHRCTLCTVKIASGAELEREQKGDADYADIATLTVKKFRVTSCEQSTYTSGTEQSCLLIFQQTEVGWESGRSIWCSNSGRREYSCFSNTFRKRDRLELH